MANKGRPRALDEGKQREVCALLAAGISRKQAAAYVGCTARTLQREGERDRQFAERMRRAEVTAALTPLQVMRNAAGSHWRAAAWMLERADPEQFGRKYRRHFGEPELRALRRDLLKILREEIFVSELRDRVAQRVRAALDYATRHAWDTNRSGEQLQSAMKFFNRRDQDDLEELLQREFPSESAAASFDRSTNAFWPKVGDYCPHPNGAAPTKPDSQEPLGGQKP